MGKNDEPITLDTLAAKIDMVASTVEKLAARVDTMATTVDQLAGTVDALAAITKASAALQEVISLGALAERQVEQLRVQLHANAAISRSRIYAGAFPSTEQNLVATGMTSEGFCL